jgi:hypothetical protein
MTGKGAEKNAKFKKKKRRMGGEGIYQPTNKVKGHKSKSMMGENTLWERSKGTELKEGNAHKGTGEKGQKEIQRRKKREEKKVRR